MCIICNDELCASAETCGTDQLQQWKKIKVKNRLAALTQRPQRFGAKPNHSDKFASKVVFALLCKCTSYSLPLQLIKQPQIATADAAWNDKSTDTCSKTKDITHTHTYAETRTRARKHKLLVS